MHTFMQIVHRRLVGPHTVAVRQGGSDEGLEAAAAEVVKWSLSARHSVTPALARCGLQSFQELNQTHKEETIKQTGFDKQRLWLVLLILTTCN